MSKTIGFHSLIDSFSLKGKKSVRNWLEKVISAHQHYAGEISIIYCSDNYLLDINKQFLNHSDYTDIITFPYTIGIQVSGDIFISIERVRENAADMHIPFETELSRVMLHGILHLLGYLDKSPEESRIMRQTEDKYLAWLDEPLHAVSRETKD